MLYDCAVTKQDYKRIDALNRLNNLDTFDVDVAKLMSNCRNNRTINSWLRLKEIRRFELLYDK